MILAEAINIIGLTEATVDGINRAYKAYASTQYDSAARKNSVTIT